MRFYTKELWSGIQSPDASVRETAEKAWRENGRAYAQCFEQIKPRFSKQFLKDYTKLAKSSNGKSTSAFLADVSNLVAKKEWAVVKNFRTVFQSDILKYGWNTVIMWILGFIPQIVISLVLSVWFTNTELRLKFQPSTQ